MKYSQLFIQTYKEDPNDAQLASHRLLHRGGIYNKIWIRVIQFISNDDSSN